MPGNELNSLNLPLLRTQLSLQTTDSLSARDFNIRRAIERGFSHLQANYLSEWVIQTTNYPASRSVWTANSKTVKENPFVNDDTSQINRDMDNALINSPRQWRAK